MSDSLKQTVEARLGRFNEPYLGTDLMSARAVRSLEVDGGHVKLELDLGFPCGDYGQELAERVRGMLEAVEGIERADVTVGFTVAARAVQSSLKRLDSVRNIIAVALAIAGASLTPSPTMATLPSDRSFLIASTLSSGIRSPQASSSPTSFAIASATF